MAIKVTVPAVVWVLGDREQVSLGASGNLTKLVRRLWYQPVGHTQAMCVGTIDADYGEALMNALKPSERRTE